VFGLRLRLYFWPEVRTFQIRTPSSDQKLGVYPNPTRILLAEAATFQIRMAYTARKLGIAAWQQLLYLHVGMW
jgi:hypothetical protein